ncbi:uncharacterized protein LOC125524451 [Triticum urartu]|uniref:Uncharacterized protein n=1 Tax=Triticum urartu TaxID=4572 RepID=A0A8R7R1R7_TRIUA|nr:uncharacterized protein LOC125524451 [Triticum urartu]
MLVFAFAGCHDRFPLREEFADSLEHPDPVPLAVLRTGEASAVVLEESNAGSNKGNKLGVAGRRSRRAACAGGVRHARSSQSSDRFNPKAPDWTKRLRLRSAPPDRMPCPSRMSAQEVSIRKYAEEPTQSVITPELGISFDSLGDGYDFYTLYS